MRLAALLLALTLAEPVQAKPRSTRRSVSLPMVVEGFGWVRVTAPCVRR